MSNSVIPARPALLVVGAVLIAVVLAALIVQALRPAAALHPEDTPEGVVQRYVLALQEGDDETAARYLDDQRIDCDPYPNETPRDLQILLKSSTVDADSAHLRVQISHPADSPPLFASDSGYEDRFELRNDDGWRIIESPWAIHPCPDADYKP